ncbi:MAG: hypothetical protein ACYDAG_06515, partial [Chloroflexota bacterium]
MSMRMMDGTGPGRQPGSDTTAYRVVNTTIHRTDGPPKVTGRAIYTADIQVANMAFAKVLRSPVAHARIRSIDAEAALSRRGVIGVVTGEDLGRLRNARYGHAIKDHPILALDKVRFVGEPVAVVIAEEELVAQEALDDVLVDYEEIEAVMDVQQALASGAPLVHETTYKEGMSAGHLELGASGQRTNVMQENHVRWGDI